MRCFTRKKLLDSEKGSFGLNLVIIMLIAGMLIILTLEWLNMNNIKEKMDNDLKRAVNIAIESSMIDEYRRDHISRIDQSIALAEFYNYLYEDLCLDHSLTYRKEGIEFQLIINEINLQEEPPEFEIIGVVELTPMFVGDMIPVKIPIPVKAKARNQRIE